MDNQVLWGEGVVFAGNRELFEVQNIGINFGVESIEGLKGDGGGKISVPAGSVYTGRIELLGLNAETLEVLTGATAAAGTYKRIRSEAQNKVTNDVTLSNTPVANSVRIVPAGSNKKPLKQVAAAPAVGEYTISADIITLNAGQTETAFVIDYFYADGASG